MQGNQKPRIQIEPHRTGTDGKGAALLYAEYGCTLDEWQQLVLDSILGTDNAGNYVTTSAGISIGRQNGKSEILIARAFYGLLINAERILFTAHQMRSVKKIFRRLEAMFTDKRHPEIIKTVKQIKYGIGEEAIMLNNGGIIEFSSRSRQAARGFDGLSLIIFDEAQELTDDQIEALMATLAASTTGQRQQIFCGTPPYIGCTGETFRRIREATINAAGRGENNGNSWHEWGIAADNLNDLDLADRRLWYESNPALGNRLTEEFTQHEYETLTKDGFARERLGFWAKPITVEAVMALDPVLWDSCGSDEPKPEGKTAYGVKFSADGAEVVLAGAVLPEKGQPARITLIACEPTGNGITWLANWLNERYKKASCVVIDGKSGTDLLIDRLKPPAGTWIFKDSVIKASTQTVINAAALLLNDLNEHAVTWYRQQEELRDSAITATKRNISGGWGFGGQTCTAIEACSLALYGVRNSKRNPQKTMKIG